MTKIIALGNALIDVMTMLPDDSTLEKLKLPKGSMQLVDKEISQNIQKITENFSKSLASGGSAANTIRSLANLGVSTGFIGKIGKDEMGSFFYEDMKNTGVFPHLKKSDSPSGVAIALVSPDTERTFATFLGAAAELNPDEINELSFNGFDILHIEGYLIYNNELIEKALSCAKNAGLRTSIDLASYNVVEDNLDFLKYIIDKYVDIVFANEDEAKAFTGEKPRKALDLISSICDIAIVKLGSEGSLIKRNNEVFEGGVIKINAVDSTGAGDNFAAGFLYGLINNWSFDRCAKAGAILAGNVMEVIGATMDKQRWINIKEEIKKV